MVIAFLRENTMTTIWLALLIAFLIVEILTIGLASIWAVGGALIAMILSLFHVPVVIQVIAFLVVTAGLLYFTRPFASKFVNSKRVRTNYEGVIGETIRIVDRVDNLSETGKTVLNGQEWTVRSESSDEILEPGTLAKIVRVSGVKLIVKKCEEE